MVIKQIFLCALLCAGFLSAYADKQLNVKLLSGKVMTVKFDESSAISFDNGCLVIEADQKTNLQISEIDHLYFSELIMSDSKAQEADYLVMLNRETGSIVLSGADGKDVTLLNVNGSVIFNQSVDSDMFTISVPSTKGVYILTIDKQSYKIIKR